MKSETGKRILAALVDFLIIAALQGAAFMAVILSSIGEQIPLNTLMIITLITSLFFFCKDCVGSSSVGKRLCKLRVSLEDGTGRPPVWKLILRNLTIPLWPFELFFFYQSKGEKRLGDYLCKTRVAISE